MNDAAPEPRIATGTLMQEAVTNAGSFATAILDLQQKWWRRYAFLRPRTP